MNQTCRVLLPETGGFQGFPTLSNAFYFNILQFPFGKEIASGNDYHSYVSLPEGKSNNDLNYPRLKAYRNMYGVHQLTQIRWSVASCHDNGHRTNLKTSFRHTHAHQVLLVLSSLFFVYLPSLPLFIG